MSCFLDSTPGLSDLSDPEVIAHLVSPPDEPRVTPCGSFLISGSLERKARIAHASSSPELSPTGAPYPSIDGRNFTQVDFRGQPVLGEESPSLRATQERPVSTLTTAGIQIQSLSAWGLFTEGSSTPTVRGGDLSVAVDGYTRQFQDETNALDYEPVGPGDVSEVTPQRLAVRGSFFFVIASCFSTLSFDFQNLTLLPSRILLITASLEMTWILMTRMINSLRMTWILKAPMMFLPVSL